jgi:hypothetical protein
MAMTNEQRQAEFNRLYETIPGRNIDRIRKVCDILGYKLNTIRVWRIKNPTRFCPERQLRILARELAKESAARK